METIKRPGNIPRLIVKAPNNGKPRTSIANPPLPDSLNNIFSAGIGATATIGVIISILSPDSTSIISRF